MQQSTIGEQNIDPNHSHNIIVLVIMYKLYPLFSVGPSVSVELCTFDDSLNVINRCENSLWEGLDCDSYMFMNW